MPRHSSLLGAATFFIQALTLVIVGAFVAGAKAQQGAEDPAVTVQMEDAQGNSVGTVEVKQLAQGVVFIADLKNLSPGGHAFHVHQHGSCQPPDFKSAGGHYNPLDKKHGFDNRQGYHAGDLPNIHVTEQSTAKAEFFTPQFTLGLSSGSNDSGQTDNSDLSASPADMTAGPFPLLDQDGSAIIIHQNPDDYEAVPPGSTGPRIACGVIQTPN